MIQDINTSIGTFDVSGEDYLFMKDFVENAVYDDYDRLVQLCDALAMPTGFCLLEKRFVDVTIRYGVHPFTVDRWKKFCSSRRSLRKKRAVPFMSFCRASLKTVFARRKAMRDEAEDFFGNGTSQCAKANRSGGGISVPASCVAVGSPCRVIRRFDINSWRPPREAEDSEAPLFHGGTFDLLMVKVIHDNRRFVERPVHGIVIAQVRQPPFFRQLPYCCVQSFPVAAAAFLVNFPIEGHQVRIAFVDVLQNYGFVAAPQIQVFQPDQVAFVFSLLHNRRNIRNARKMGEMKQVVRIPASWKVFMAASLREMLTAMSISA